MKQEIKDVLKNYSISQPSEKCFSFWKEKSFCGNRVYQVLSNLAESYLTPHPTTTDVESIENALKHLSTGLCITDFIAYLLHG